MLENEYSFFSAEENEGPELKEEWDSSIVWRTSFRNKQWKLLFIYRFYLYQIS